MLLITLYFAFFIRNIHRCRGFALDQMDRLEAPLFKRMFRVDRETFNYILDKIDVHFTSNEEKATNSSGQPVVLKTRLAISLRWLAGGSYLDLCFAWGVAVSTFYAENGVLWPTLAALDAVFPIGFPVNDDAKLEELARGFYNHSGGILDGCVMAIDGFGVSTRCPFKTEVVRPKDYRFRKGGFAIIVLAGCDVNAKFVCASCTHSGSTNDIIAWGDSNLYQMLEIDRLVPEDFFFIGDEAFTNTQQFLSPWPGKSHLSCTFYLRSVN